MANALSGTAGSVAYITGGTTAIGAIKEWSLSLTHNPVETTAFGENWQTYIASIRGATGSFSGNGDNSDSAQTSLRNAMMGGSAVALRFYNGPDWYWEAGTAYLTGNERSISNEGKLELSYDFTVSGVITYGGVWLHNGTWSIGINSLTNSPTLGSELITNADMETGSPPSSYTTTQVTLAADADVHGGSQALRVTSTEGTSDRAEQIVTLAVGNWVQFSGWGKRGSQGTQQVFNVGNTNAPVVAVATTSYAQYFTTGRVTTANPIIRLYANQNTGAVGDYGLYDDISLKTFTLNQLMAVRPGATNPNSVAANLTISSGYYCGVVYGLDSYTSPTTFIGAVHDGVSSIQLFKCVSGTYTSLVSSSATYVAGAQIKIVYTGSNTYQVWYNGTQRGTDQTVSDAGTGGLHGGFSVNSANTITGFVIA